MEYIKAELERRHEAANRQQVIVKPTQANIIDRLTDRSWSH